MAIAENTGYIDTLKRDTGAFEASEIAALMADKRLWKDLVVAHIRATKWWMMMMNSLGKKRRTWKSWKLELDAVAAMDSSP